MLFRSCCVLERMFCLQSAACNPRIGKVNLQLNKQDVYKLCVCVRREYVCRLTFILNINRVVSRRYNDDVRPKDN